jgi:hypothetical protein
VANEIDPADPLAGVAAEETVTETAENKDGAEPLSEAEATAAAIKEVLAAEDASKAEKTEPKEPKAEDAPPAPKEPKEEADPAEETEEAEEEEEAEPPKPEAADADAKKAKEAKEAEDAAKAAKARKEEAEHAERLSKLAARERKLVSDQAALKTQLADHGKVVEELATLKRAVEMIDRNPMRALQLLGKDFRKASERALELTKNPALGLEDELANQRTYFEAELAKERKAREEEARKSNEAAQVAARDTDKRNTFAFVKEKIRAGGDSYELIQAEGIEERLAGELWDHFVSTGEVVSLEDFLAHTEKELEAKLEKKLATKKGKARLLNKTTAQIAAEKIKAAKEAAAPEPEETENEPIEQTVKRVKRTLTNGASTRVAPVPVKPKEESSGDTWADARNEALALLEAEERKRA